MLDYLIKNKIDGDSKLKGLPAYDIELMYVEEFKMKKDVKTLEKREENSAGINQQQPIDI